jgi:hypothetical protein
MTRAKSSPKHPEARPLSADDTVDVVFADAVTVGSIEQKIRDQAAASRRAQRVLFDLRTVQFVGLFPMTLLARWIEDLLSVERQRNSSRTVTVKLPSMLEGQVARMLLDMGFAQFVRECGGTIDPFSPYDPKNGLPITSIDDRTTLLTRLHSLRSDFAFRCDIRRDWESVVAETFNVVMFELAENALIHAQTSATLAAKLTEASGSGDQVGLMRLYPRGVQYLEVVVSDNGKGLSKSLAAPKTWTPPGFLRRGHSGSKRHLNDAEKAVLFSFEYGSTSDPDGRIARIAELLGGLESVDPGDVPTGLYCVLRTVHAVRGQLLVRTPNAIVSFDFFDNPDRPDVRFKESLGLETLGRLPGTHFLLRLPLIESLPAPESATVDTESPLAVSVSEAFPPQGAETFNEAVAIQQGLMTVAAHLQSLADQDGLTVIPPAAGGLSSRGRTVFAAGLVSMLRGRQSVMWLENSMLFESTAPVVGSTPQPLVHPFTCVGDPFENTWLISPHAGARLHPAERGRLPESYLAEVLGSLEEHFTSRLRLELVSNAIRRTDGPFRFRDRYYTKLFFDIATLLDDPTWRLFLAYWVALRLLKNGRGYNIDLLIATPLALSEIAAVGAHLLSRRVSRPISASALPGNPLVSQVGRLVSEHRGENIAIITDVVSTGRTLERILEQSAPDVTPQSILTLVDGRPELERGEFRSRRLPSAYLLETLVEETFRTEPFLPPTLVKEGLKGFQTVDPDTHRLTFHAVASGPRQSRETFLHETLPETRAITVGHTDRDGKHFTFFINLRVFFHEQRSNLVAWIVESSNEWKASLTAEPDVTDHPEPSLYILSRSGELSWTADDLELRRRFGPQGVSHHASQKDLCIAVGKSPSPHCVVLLPALASGRTARDVLRTIANGGARSVLLLVIASRATNEQWQFLESVTRLGSACDTRIERFIDFEVDAFDPHAGGCPICNHVTRLIQLADAFDERHPAGTALGRFIREKAHAMKERGAALSVDEHAPLSRLGSDERDQLAVRLLYEAASEDDSAREALRSQLQEPTIRNALLAVLARERYDSRFSRGELARRLGPDIDVLGTHAETLMDNIAPPFPLARILTALVYLRPSHFQLRGSALYSRYRNFPRDAFELALAIAESTVEPISIHEKLYQDGSTLADAAMSEAVDFALGAHESIRTVGREGVRAAIELWIELALHSHLGKEFNELTAALIPEEIDWAELRWRIGSLKQVWYERLAPILERLLAGGFWLTFTRLAPEKSLPAALQTHVSTIIRSEDLSPETGRDDAAKVRGQLLDALQHAKAICEQLAAFLIKHNQSLLQADIAGTEVTVIMDETGRSIMVDKSGIDRRIRNTFVDLESFNYITLELQNENWRRHAASAPDVPILRLSMSEDEQYTSVAFEDNIPGNFREESRGGIRHVRDFCASFGGWLELSTHDERGTKRMILHLQRMPQDIQPRIGQSTERSVPRAE